MVEDAVNWVHTYTVSDTETLRKIHLFMWPEVYDGNRETRSDAFSTQDLPAEEGRPIVARLLEMARRQAAESANPAVREAAADAAARLGALTRTHP
ncbi:MAG: hypothetical protein HUU15_04515 [Candidatus Brocadiae bacterium]|nr:hypothetical protein [Candidatus Brocadiia bacterium]